MVARIHTNSGPVDLRSVSLENRALRVTVIPELGGKVFELIDKAADLDLLWHNERTPPRPAPYGAHFDDWWSGGWDEIFPTGDRAVLHDELLPYMGELWSVPWTARSEVVSEEAVLRTSTYATMAPARFERRLSLRGDEPVLRASYRIVNLDVRPLPFLWGIHPAFSVGPDHRIDHPATRCSWASPRTPRWAASASPTRGRTCPIHQRPRASRDVRVVRPRSDGVFGGHWATDLQQGWLALTNTDTRRGLALSLLR